jgi:protein SCO1/2
MKIDIKVLLDGCKRILLLGALAIGFATLSAAPTFASNAGSVWGKDYFPNYELTAHTGETLRFFDDVIEGKVVAVNFIFTSCKDVFFHSITIDPETDTVEVLHDYAERFGVDGDNWKFLTGNKEEIDIIREKFGLFGDPEEEQDLSNHNINLMLGNQSTGQWVRRSPFENPYILANQLGTWLHGFRQVSAHTNRDYASAPKLRQISDGEMMFRDRCSSCHVISGGFVPQRNVRPLGPDLFGVTERRDAAWLRRWMAEPDKMVESGDPIAVAMSGAWEVVMPNFSLDPNEIDNLIRYIESESDRLRQRYASASGDGKGGHHDHAAHHGNH